jgi:DNA-binding NarL/FixJ family response regulator
MAASTTIFLAEDHELMRDGLRAALTRQGKFEIVGEAADGAAAVAGIKKLRPDVVVMDIGMPVMDGIEAAKQVKQALPETKVVMLTSHDSEQEIFASLASGANGYCLKDLTGDKLILAISSVAEGALWIDPRIAKRVLDVMTFPPAAAVSAEGNASIPLSQRETEVLRLMVDGLTNQEIAARLIIGVSTVRTHVQHILEKLAVSGRTEAAVKAMRNALI